MHPFASVLKASLELLEAFHPWTESQAIGVPSVRLEDFGVSQEAAGELGICVVAVGPPMYL